MNAEHAELAALLTLLATPRVTGPHIIAGIGKYGSACETLARLRSDVGAPAASAARSDTVRAHVDAALATLDAQRIHVIRHDDALYPDLMRLRLAEHAPPALFARGRLELLAAHNIAVVGCRRATSYGLDVAEEIGAGIARAGGCVVSGVALGIDAAAHTAALEAGGATIGVLGTGLDIHYPPQNRALQDRIARDGLLLSELLPGTRPRRHTFPHRNRIIAALSSAVVVVEAGERSGAITTAHHAAAQGTNVWCVPNLIYEPNMQGNLILLREGALTYTGLRDLLEEVGLVPLGDRAPADLFDESPPDDAVHARVWGVLGRKAEHADAIAARAGLTTSGALVALLELELDGRVRQLPGQRFERRRRREEPARNG